MLILVAPRGVPPAPLFCKTEVSPPDSPPTHGLPSPGLGSPQSRKAPSSQVQGPPLGLFSQPCQGEGGLLTSHHIHVRQSRGGFQRC